MRPNWLLAIGIAIVVFFVLREGGDIFPRTADHVIHDLTVDLALHLFIAGWVLIAIGAYFCHRSCVRLKSAPPRPTRPRTRRR